MAAITQHTAPGTPRPGYASTCPQARLAEPSQSDGLYPHPLRLPPAEHVTAPHQGHPSGASAPVSRVLADPPAAASLGRLAPRGGLSCSRGTGTRTMSTSRPRGATSAQTPNKQQTKILVSIHQNMCTRISTNIL
jgi:hypothetical protein